jgi:hypothetical protein
MHRFISISIAVSLGTGLFFFGSAQTGTASTTQAKTVKAAAPAQEAKTPQASPTTKKPSDTLVVVARLVEIPGEFASNDLYNYVYIMKYRVLTVVKGVCGEQEILVGHYNPLIPRNRITDDMKKSVSGNVDKFEVGAKHQLVLIKPIDRVWKDAVEDDYSDSEQDKFFALKADKAQ